MSIVNLIELILIGIFGLFYARLGHKVLGANDLSVYCV